MRALDVAATRYRRVRPRLVATALRYPRAAQVLLRARNELLAAAGRPEHGHRLAAALRAAAARSTTDVDGVRTWPAGPLQWVVLDGLPGSPSSRYRVEALRRALHANGHAVTLVEPGTLERHADVFVSADVVVLFRVGAGAALTRVLDVARAAGALVVYDIDDLVFDPAVANATYVDGVRHLPLAERPLYEAGVRSYREALLQADLVTVPTPGLARAAEAAGRPALVVPNSLLDPWLQVASHQHGPGQRVVIGYASGTRTHERDFAEAVEGLARVLRARPEALLRVVGELDLTEFPQLEGLSGQIEHRAGVPFDELPALVAEFDVNLAPLEVGNPYCEAKSELKFFEAAAVGVPTVASPTEPYRLAIEDGVSGFLARGADAWETALDALCADPELRSRMGEAARERAHERHGVLAHGAAVTAVEERLRGLAPSAEQVLTLLLPGIDAGGGGASKAMDLFSGLARPGRALQVVVQQRTASFSDAASIASAYRLSERGITTILSRDLVPSSDVTMTTFYTTALLASEAPGRAGRVVQLLQDYEPLFFPMSEQHLAARNSLELPHAPVTYGPWVAHMLAQHHGRDDAHVLPYYIDTALYSPGTADRVRGPLRLAVLARPEMPRRCWPLAQEAVREVVDELGDEVEVVLFGSEHLRHSKPRFPHVDLGVVTPAELAALYRRCDVGLVVSPTNPSMVPFEMMACGLPVVDVDVPFQDDNYGGRDNVVLAHPDAHSLSRALIDLLRDEERRRQVADNGQRWARALPDAQTVQGLLAAHVDRLVPQSR